MAINDKFSYPTYWLDASDEKKLKINKQIEDNYLSTIDWNIIDPYFPNLTQQQKLFHNNITNLINHFHLSELESFVLSSAREYLDYCGWSYDDVKIEDSWTVFGQSWFCALVCCLNFQDRVKEWKIISKIPFSVTPKCEK